MNYQSNSNKQEEPESAELAQLLKKRKKAKIVKNPYPKDVRKLCLLCGKAAKLKCVCLYSYCCESCKISDWAHHIKICHKMQKLPEKPDDEDDDNTFDLSGTISNGQTSSNNEVSNNNNNNSKSSNSSISKSNVNIETNSSTLWTKNGRRAKKAEAIKYPPYFIPAFSASPLFPSSHNQIIISNFVSLNTFYLRAFKQNSAYCSLVEAIQQYSLKSEPLFIMPTVGDIALTKRDEYTYARVFVTDVQNSFNITCFYVDYGDTVIKALDELRLLKFELQRAQRFILETRLKNVPDIPMTEIKDDLLKYIISLANTDGIVEFKGDYVIDKEVDLFSVPQRELINKKIMELYEKSK